MRYRFRGLVRETGKVVEGHVEALTEEQAYTALSENGIVTESLRPDPRPLNLGAAPQTQYADAIDSALDTSASQIPFDALAERFRGKNVWVLDREKIRRRVAEVVDQALRANLGTGEQDDVTRAKVAEAIEGLFKDNRNITSRVDEADRNIRQTTNRAQEVNVTLERQINRLANFINKAENVLTQISTAARNIGSGGGGWGGGGYVPRGLRGKVDVKEQNLVLKEIFDANVSLLQSMEQKNMPPVDEEVLAGVGAEAGGGGDGGAEMSAGGGGDELGGGGGGDLGGGGSLDGAPSDNGPLDDTTPQG